MTRLRCPPVGRRTGAGIVETFEQTAVSLRVIRQTNPTQKTVIDSGPERPDWLLRHPTIQPTFQNEYRKGGCLEVIGYGFLATADNVSAVLVRWKMNFVHAIC
jgi:hypothetical protein